MEIVPEVLRRMKQQFGCDPQEAVVGVSAGADECCYEVDDQTADYFLKDKYEDVVMYRAGRTYINLKNAIKCQLLFEKVPEDQIQIMNECTICNSTLFSYRREQENAGRNGLFAWIKK